MKADIDKLLLEAQRSKLTERRTEPRHPFVRPVQITLTDGTAAAAFSKDMSQQGIGVITDMNLATGTIATLSIPSTSMHPVHIKSELRWSDSFGKGWFTTGWKFMAAASPPRK